MIVLKSAVGNYVSLEGKKYSYFGGNNYLGLANNPVIKKAALKAIKKYGLNFSASRETTGTSEIHLELEKEISLFKNKENSVVFASGYLSNKILIHALQDQFSVVLADESSHPSIIDGIPDNIKKYFYRHLDHADLENLLIKTKKQKALIISDGLFPLSGEIAPLDKIYTLAKKHSAIIVVDDAHATAILGKKGLGTPEYFGLHKKDNIFQTETMSKALGVYGGFISASNEIINKIRKTSSVYIGSTALPPPIVSAGQASLKFVQRNSDMRIKLLKMAVDIRKRIQNLDYRTTDFETPIIPLFFSKEKQAHKLSDFLKEYRIIVPYINYPVKNSKALLRISVSINHTPKQIDQLINFLKKWREKYGVNEN